MPALLKITKDSTKESVEKQYKKLALQYHPDRNPGNKDAEAAMKQLNNEISAFRSSEGLEVSVPVADPRKSSGPINMTTKVVNNVTFSQKFKVKFDQETTGQQRVQAIFENFFNGSLFSAKVNETKPLNINVDGETVRVGTATNLGIFKNIISQTVQVPATVTDANKAIEADDATLAITSGMMGR